MAFTFAALCYLIALIAVAFCIFFAIYTVICIDELKTDYKNPIEQCRSLNQLILPEYIVHGIFTVLFLLSWQLFSILINSPLVAYHVMSYMRRPVMSGPGIYDPTRILNRLELSHHMRVAWIKLAFYLISFFYYLYALIYTLVTASSRVARKLGRYTWLPYLATLLALAAITAFVLTQSIHSRPRLQSFGSLILILLFSVLISDNPGRIKWRPVICGLVLQYLVALLILKWDAGRDGFRFLIDQIVFFLGYTSAGTDFVFGFIPSPPNFCGMDGPFSFTSLPILIFFSAICSAAYYAGFVQWVCKKTAVLLQWTMGTTSAESLNAMGSVFIGPTDGSLLMQFALPTMTYSEIVAALAVGYSMLDGSLFALYIAFGACPTLLLSANVMSAPAVLTISKILSPEVQKSKQADMETFEFPPTEAQSLLDAICKGAVSAMGVIFAIIANLIVFLALLAFLDKVIGFVCDCVGYEDVTFNKVLGWAFFPLAYVMGVSDADTWEAQKNEILKVAQLIGTKTALNEFIAYQQMQGMLLNGEIGSRAQLMAIYCLCGYSNPSQIGTQLGIYGAMCPKRKKDFVTAAPKGLLIGSLACFMTACVAGSIITTDMGCRPTTNPLCFDVSNGTNPEWISAL
ncbi:unnamed protein product, partial [Mesorhabditis belari]|uniref:Sodium/nucleoside cotransporter n=1 Tax=Mesorhabditis belari TaxID=2138241 RepID=A0AAF3ELA8_9BILA